MEAERWMTVETSKARCPREAGHVAGHVVLEFLLQRNKKQLPAAEVFPQIWGLFYQPKEGGKEPRFPRFPTLARAQNQALEPGIRGTMEPLMGAERC